MFAADHILANHSVLLRNNQLNLPTRALQLGENQYQTA